MKRLAVSLIILVLALGTSAAGFFALRDACDELTAALETVKSNASVNSAETAAAADSLTSLWNKKSPLIHILVNHDETKDAELNIAGIPIAAENGEYAQIVSICEETQSILFHIKSSYEPTIGNILRVKFTFCILTGLCN